MSQLTKTGLRESGGKVGSLGEGSDPGVVVIWSRCEKRERACPVSNSSPFRSPLRLDWPPVEIATDGVHHFADASAACIDNGVPPWANFLVRWLVSSARGVVHFAACAGRGTPPVPKVWFGPPFSPSLALGVDQVDPERFLSQITAVSLRGRALPQSIISSWLAPLWSRFWGVGLADPPDGEDEEAFALMAEAHTFRAEESALNLVTQAV